MQISKPGFYRQRNGAKAEVRYVSGVGYAFGFIDSGDPFVWHVEGKAHYVDIRFDLIAPWTEEVEPFSLDVPQAAPSAPPAPAWDGKVKLVSTRLYAVHAPDGRHMGDFKPGETWHGMLYLRDGTNELIVQAPSSLFDVLGHLGADQEVSVVTGSGDLIKHLSGG